MKIECKKNWFGRAFLPVCLSLLFMAMATGFWQPRFFGWLIWVMLLFGSFNIFPDLFIQEDGMEVATVFRKYWITWEDIKQVRSNGIDTRFYATNLGCLHHMLSLSIRTGIFTITPLTHKNYDEAVSFIREKSGKKFSAW
jgi:hypothetical protein